MRFLVLLFTIVGFCLAVTPEVARAEYKVCGIFVECGVFIDSSRKVEPSSDKTVEEKTVYVMELIPGEITFLAVAPGQVEDGQSYGLKFDDQGRFKIEWANFFEVGEGSCQNFICQFKIDEREYASTLERPSLDISGTVTFAHDQIIRADLRKAADQPPFLQTGVLDDICSSPERRQQLTRSEFEVTEQSCLYFYESRLRRALPFHRGSLRNR